ncbi:hypothetical protein LINPERPRIM_LOCUS36327 [Linum perenne]
MQYFQIVYGTKASGAEQIRPGNVHHHLHDGAQPPCSHPPQLPRRNHSPEKLLHQHSFHSAVDGRFGIWFGEKREAREDSY